MTAEERLAKLAEKEKRIKAQMRQIRARENEKERKARTRRLIQSAAAIESIFKKELERDFDDDDMRVVIEFIESKKSTILQTMNTRHDMKKAEHADEETKEQQPPKKKETMPPQKTTSNQSSKTGNDFTSLPDNELPF